MSERPLIPWGSLCFGVPMGTGPGSEQVASAFDGAPNLGTLRLPRLACLELCQAVATAGGRWAICGECWKKRN